MKYSIVFTLSGLLMAVSAQLDGLPDCAQKCAMDSLPEDCGLDPACICASKSFIDGISCCVVDACTPDEQEASITYAKSICEPAGVDTIPESAGCSGSEPTGTAAPTEGEASGTAASTEGEASATATPTVTDDSATGTGTSAATDAAETTGGAAALIAQNGGALAVAAAAFAILI